MSTFRTGRHVAISKLPVGRFNCTDVDYHIHRAGSHLNGVLHLESFVVRSKCTKGESDDRGYFRVVSFKEFDTEFRITVVEASNFESVLLYFFDKTSDIILGCVRNK